MKNSYEKILNILHHYNFSSFTSNKERTKNFSSNSEHKIRIKYRKCDTSRFIIKMPTFN